MVLHNDSNLTNKSLKIPNMEIKFYLQKLWKLHKNSRINKQYKVNLISCPILDPFIWLKLDLKFLWFWTLHPWDRATIFFFLIGLRPIDFQHQSTKNSRKNQNLYSQKWTGFNVSLIGSKYLRIMSSPSYLNSI